MAIMKASLETGVVPDDWKAANVTPIFKKGSKSEIGNYRPVSLTSQICKLLEMIIRQYFSLISASQHGFRRGGSCLSNLLQFLDRITNSIDNRDSVDVIYLDFTKSFDKVLHLRLLDKLSKHGISGRVWTWIKEWMDTWENAEGVFPQIQVFVEDGHKRSPAGFSPWSGSIPHIYQWPRFTFGDLTIEVRWWLKTFQQSE